MDPDIPCKNAEGLANIANVWYIPRSISHHKISPNIVPSNISFSALCRARAATETVWWVGTSNAQSW